MGLLFEETLADTQRRSTTRSEPINQHALVLLSVVFVVDAMHARPTAAHDEALDCELLLQSHLLVPVLPLPAADDVVLSSLHDANDLAWLLPLLDSDPIEDQRHSSSAHTSPNASPSPQRSDSTSDTELSMSARQTCSDNSSKDSTNSQCASPLDRSDDALDAWSPHAHAHIASPSIAPAAALKASKKPVFASTHARQKHEKQVLTQEAQALEATLAHLQTRARTSAPSTLSVVRKNALIAQQAPLHTVWRDAAATEQTLLQRSVRTNKRLRERLTEHKRLSKSLQRMLLDRAARAAVRLSRASPVSSAVSMSRSRTHAFVWLLCVCL